MDEARIAAARRRIDAAVGAGRGQHAERRHADELFRVDIDLRSRLGDHARRGGGIDRGQVASGKVGQGTSPVWIWTRLSSRREGVILIGSKPRLPARSS